MGPMKSALDMRQSRSLQGGMVRKHPERDGTKAGKAEKRGRQRGPEQGAGLRPPVWGEGVRSP